MRILYIGTPYSIHDIKWITFFSKTVGYEVFFVCEQQNIPKNKTEEDLKTFYRDLNVTYLGSLHTFSASSPFASLKSVFKLRRLIRENKIDLVHILFAGPFAIWGLFVTTKYIITTRGSDILITIPDLLNHKGLKGWYMRFMFGLFRRSFNNASYITSTSSAQKNKCIELMGKPEPIIIRTGVDVDVINAVSDNHLIDERVRNKKFIFSPRYFKPIYNILVQVRAISLLSDELIKGYCWVFIKGESFDNSYLQSLEELLKALKQTRGLQYIILDKLSQAEMAQYYKHASLTIMTPISDGTPNTALEAMSAKCPLIIPNLKYDEVLFNNTCIQLKSYEPAEIAEKIALALTNYPPQLIENGFSAVSNYGNRKVEMLKLKELYIEAVKN